MIRQTVICGSLVWFMMISGCIDSQSKKLEFCCESIFPEEITQFDPVEIQFDLTKNNWKNPFDRDEISVDLVLSCPDGTQLTHPAFFTIDHQIIFDHGREVVRNTGKAHWEVRWTPTQSGQYKWEILATSKGQLARMDGRSYCKPGNRPGFVRVSITDPKYFELSNGSFFYPLGHVLRSPSDARVVDDDRERISANHTLMEQKTFAYERWFQQMAANHENFCSIWMAPWWLGIEWSPVYPGYEGLGRYNQIHAAQLDRILKLADHYGIYVQLFAMNHGQLSTVTDAEWEANPYRAANGGPASTASEVFESEACDKLFQQRLNYILARWGYSPSLFGVALCTETEWVELYHGYRCDRAQELVDGISKPNYSISRKPLVVTDWLKRLSHYWRTHDIHGHVVTTQLSRIDSDQEIWNHPEFDFVINNCYENAFSFLSQISEFDPSPGGSADMIWRWSRIHDIRTKPKLMGEWGGSHLGNSRSRLANDLHIGLWSLIMTDCAGATGFWWWNEIENANLYPQFQAVYNFINGYDRRGKQLEQSHGDVSTTISSFNRDDPAKRQFVPHPSRAALVLSNQTEAFAYLYHRLVSCSYVASTSIDDYQLDQAIDTYLTVPVNLQAGRYRIEFWDTFRGEIIGTRDQLIGEPGSTSRQIAILPVRSDLALKIVPVEEPSHPNDEVKF